MLTVEVLHELDRAFHDSWPRRRRTAPAVELFGPRRGHSGCQLVVGSEGAVEVRAGDLRRRGGGTLPAPATYHVVFVPCEENSTFGDEPAPKGFLYHMTTTDLTAKARRQVVREAPFELAEPLVPARRGIRERPGRPVVLFVDYAIPADAKPGLYSGQVEILSDSHSVEVPVELEVYAATLPEEQKLKVTNWFNITRMAQVHGVEMWSEPFWRVLRESAKLMAAHRQTMFWVKPEVFDLRLVDGEVHMNLERLARYIRLFLAQGFTQIEGPHISHRHALKDSVTFMNWAAPGGAFGDETRSAQRPRGKNEQKASVLGPVPTTLEGHALLREWLVPFWEFLGRHGWQDIYYQHLFDEPLPEQGEHYRHLSLIVRQLLPGVKTIDAVHIEGLNGASDVIVPSYLGGPRRERTFAEQNRRCGVETWYYTCCGPRGKWLNRLLDFPLIRTRLLHWYNYITGTTGYLHWGLNFYRPGQDPWKWTVPAEAEQTPDGKLKLPPGDTHIIWPGGKRVYGSLRFTAMRNGIEDYELMAMLREDPKRAARADEIVDQVIRSGTSYVQNPVTFDRHRRRLLALASGRRRR